MPWNLGSKTISRVWRFVDQFAAGAKIGRVDHDTALEDIKDSVNAAIAYLITQIDAAASSELYLGVAPSPPTENAAGGALEQGNLYIKSPEYEAYVWTGSEWTLAEQFASASTYFKGLVTAADAAALRTLLGLGSAATFASTSFASTSEIAAEAERLTNALRPVISGGTGNAFTIVSADPITTYADGQAWLMRADRAPTGAATLNVDGLGARDIRKVDGSNSLVDIASGDWSIGDLVPFFYDGTRFIVPKYGLLKPPLDENDMASNSADRAPSQRSTKAYVDGRTPAPFTSTAQTITSGGALTIPHGLGAVPKSIQVWLRCATEDLGYAVNDTVFINPGPSAFGSTISAGVSIVFDATNITVRFGSNVGAIALIRKDTGAVQVITNGNWQFFVRAWP